MQTLFALAAFFLLAVFPALAQNATVTAHLGPGQTVNVTANKVASESAYIEIALPKGAQRFDGIGEQLMPFRVNGHDTLLAVEDFDGDGIDKIIVRGSVPPEASAILVYQWDGQKREYVQVEFTNDQDEAKPFLFADAKSAVSIDKTGIEIRVERADQNGRTASVIERYKWDGTSFHYAADN